VGLLGVAVDTRTLGLPKLNDAALREIADSRGGMTQAERVEREEEVLVVCALEYGIDVRRRPTGRSQLISFRVCANAAKRNANDNLRRQPSLMAEPRAILPVEVVKVREIAAMLKADLRQRGHRGSTRQDDPSDREAA
jgi:hypothetical protein